jgi:hypothetical protein
MKNVAMIAFGLILIYFLWVFVNKNKAAIVSFLYNAIGVLLIIAAVVIIYAMVT